MGVEAITPIIHEFFQVSFDIIVGLDGIVDHFLGDAIMAYFNVPIAHEDHAVRAVTAATRIHSAVPGINAKAGGLELLRVGIGIDSGWVMPSMLHPEHCGDYTVVGDTVNVASRLQGYAASGETIVTEDVYEAVKSEFPHARRQEWQLKGIPGPVAGYVL